MVAGCRVKAQLQQRHHFGVPTGARTAAVWGPNRCRSVHRTLQLCVNAWVPLDTSGDGGGRSTLDPVDGTAACVSQAQLDMSRRCRPTTSHVHLNSRDTFAARPTCIHFSWSSTTKRLTRWCHSLPPS